MTTVDALKGLYVTLGGSESDVENITLIPDMITAFESIDSLQAVTTDASKNTTISGTEIYVKIGTEEAMTLEDYIKQVAGIS